ncbi:hypothetical protein J2S57_005919 [Kineosporia succinea]|uniref:Uncharacterized protein n=1 Tax=Kineosporia succinea TaxID=84632 RepID=A0ABT9PBU6_9ACTN|nr:hypothetical protein [Kineosporia succinea]
MLKVTEVSSYIERFGPSYTITVGRTAAHRVLPTLT